MRRTVLMAAVLGVLSCGRGSRAEAEQAVRTYLARLVDAYRTSDASLVDPLVSEQQGLKLIGLIGVKRDAGVILDAKLLELAFVRAERDGDRWIVETRERWYYRDRKIGTGEQVGEDSTDAYVMHYVFSRTRDGYVLEDLSFVGEPQVGRKSAHVPVDARILHGLSPEDAAPAPAPPGAAATPATGGRRGRP